METNLILSGTETIIGKDELLDKISSGKKLKVKFGVDPTRPDLTFGHLVVFNKLKQFQDAGHDAILLIGDYTARIGDPSGRSEVRPELTEEEVEQNAATYLDQAFKILDSEIPKFSRRRPTQPSRLVGFQQETAFHTPRNPIFGPARGQIFEKCGF